MGAYSCADGMGGGKNGDPGDGKGEEEDSLRMVNVSEGLSGMGELNGVHGQLGHRPFVSGVMRAEVICEKDGTEEEDK